MTLKESNYTPREVKLHSMSQIMLLIGSFDPFKEVIVNIGNCNYTSNSCIWFPFSFQRFVFSPKSQPSRMQMFGKQFNHNPPQVLYMSDMIYFYYQDGFF